MDGWVAVMSESDPYGLLLEMVTPQVRCSPYGHRQPIQEKITCVTPALVHTKFHVPGLNGLVIA